MLDIEIGAQETQIDPANSSALKIPAGLSLELFEIISGRQKPGDWGLQNGLTTLE